MRPSEKRKAGEDPVNAASARNVVPFPLHAIEQKFPYFMPFIDELQSEIILDLLLR
jgi:hypothetical protein